MGVGDSKAGKARRLHYDVVKVDDIHISVFSN